MSDPTIRGRFLWHELLTTDTSSASAFYGKVAGWKTQAWDKDSSYTLFTMGGPPMGGLMTLPEEAKAMGAPPNWLSHIGTTDVDETARQAVSLGGRILKPAETIPTVGRFAVLQDPQGAVFSIYKPDQQPQPSGVPAVGDFSWHELATTDWRAALAFYKRLFGWEETTSMDMGPELGMYQMYGKGGTTFGGIYNKPSQMPGPPFWLPYIKVPDAKKAAATTTRLGGKIVNGPMEVPGGDMIAVGMDLQGAAFAVHSAKAAAKSAQARPAAAAKPARAKAAAKAPAKAAAKPKARASKSKGKAKAKPKAKARSKGRARPKKAAKKRVPARRRGRSGRRR